MTRAFSGQNAQRIKLRAGLCAIGTESASQRAQILARVIKLIKYAEKGNSSCCILARNPSSKRRTDVMSTTPVPEREEQGAPKYTLFFTRDSSSNAKSKESTGSSKLNGRCQANRTVPETDSWYQFKIKAGIAYLISTAPPAPSISSFSLSASSYETPSLTAFGALSTNDEPPFVHI